MGVFRIDWGASDLTRGVPALVMENPIYCPECGGIVRSHKCGRFAVLECAKCGERLAKVTILQTGGSYE